MATRVYGPSCRPQLGPIWRTLSACVAVLLCFAAVLGKLTGGLEYWSFEDVRRNDARLGRLAATALPVRTTQGSSQMLWSGAEDPLTIYIVSFIYTACPFVCQSLGSGYQQMQDALAAQDTTASGRIRLVSLSFDIDRDDTGQLQAYADRYRATSPVWNVAVPISRTDSARLLRQLGVVVVADGFGGYVHNGAIHVIDANGTVLAIYDDRDWTEALSMALHRGASRP